MRAREFISPTYILREYNRDITLRNRKIRDGILRQYAGDMPEERFNQLYQNTDYGDAIVNRVMAEIERTEIPGVPKNYFAPWLALWMSQGWFNPTQWSEGDTSAWRFRGVIPLLEAFYKYKDKGWFPREHRDIYKLNPVDLNNVITNLNIPEKAVNNRGRTAVVLDNSELRIIHLLDKEAAIYYGQGTNPRWCTSYTDSDNRFDYYNERGPLYVLLPKTPKHVGEKYQMHFSEQQSDEYTDERNRMIGFYDLINRFGEEFKEWLLGLRPKYEKTMLLADEETVLELWQGFGYYIYNRFKEEGEKIVEDGRTHVDGEEYMDWAKSTQQKIMDIWSELRYAPINEIREVAKASYDEDQSAWNITDVAALWDPLFDKYAKAYKLHEYNRPNRLFDLYDVMGSKPYIVKADEVATNDVTRYRYILDRKRIGDYIIGILGGYR